MELGLTENESKETPNCDNNLFHIRNLLSRDCRQSKARAQKSEVKYSRIAAQSSCCHWRRSSSHRRRSISRCCSLDLLLLLSLGALLMLLLVTGQPAADCPKRAADRYAKAADPAAWWLTPHQGSSN